MFNESDVMEVLKRIFAEENKHFHMNFNEWATGFMTTAIANVLNNEHAVVNAVFINNIKEAREHG